MSEFPRVPFRNAPAYEAAHYSAGAAACKRPVTGTAKLSGEGIHVEPCLFRPVGIILSDRTGMA